MLEHRYEIGMQPVQPCRIRLAAFEHIEVSGGETKMIRWLAERLTLAETIVIRKALKSSCKHLRGGLDDGFDHSSEILPLDGSQGQSAMATMVCRRVGGAQSAMMGSIQPVEHGRHREAGLRRDHFTGCLRALGPECFALGSPAAVEGG